MEFNKTSIGAMGERIAEKGLKRMGYKILEKNFHTRFGEIDIIANDGEFLVFVEVRLRKSEEHGTPFETVTYYKQQRIRKSALLYSMRCKTMPPIRFDVVGIVGEYKGKKFVVETFEVIKNAYF